MYNLSIDTPANRMIAEQLANNRIRSDMIFPTEPMHIQPHGVWSGGWRYTPYLLAGTNQQYPPLHLGEVMRISSGGMIHHTGLMYADRDADHSSGNVAHTGVQMGGRKPKKFLGMTTGQWKDTGKNVVKNLRAVSAVASPVLMAAAPELAPGIIAANAALAAAPVGRGRGRPRKIVPTGGMMSGCGPSGGERMVGGKKKNIIKNITSAVKKAGEKVAKVAKAVYNAPEFQPIKAYGKDLAKKELVKVVNQISPQTGTLGNMALEYGANKAYEQIEGAGRKRGRPRKMEGAGVTGGKKKSVLKSIGKFVADAGKKVAKVAKAVYNDPAFQPVKAYGKELARDELRNVVSQISPQTGVLGNMALQVAAKKADEAIAGAGRKKRAPKAPKAAGASDGRAKRAEIVKKVMKEQGLKMIEASKYVKAHGLY